MFAAGERARGGRVHRLHASAPSCIRESLKFHDFGVLLRANHLTRAIEEAFLKENIPYRVSGGMSFFERQEVRDMLAYLQPHRQPRRRHQPPAHHQHPAPRHRQEGPGEGGRGRGAPDVLPLLGFTRPRGGSDDAAGLEEKSRAAVREFTRDWWRSYRDALPRPGRSWPRPCAAGGGDRLLGPPREREQGREETRTW